MEYPSFKISDPLGGDLIMKDELRLSEYLDLPSSHWNGGSGDSALWKEDGTDGLLFFKTDDAYFVMEISSYLSPIQNQDQLQWMKHNIGGEPFHFSSRHLCTKEVLMTILIHYINTAELLKEFNWFDPLPDEDIFLKFQGEQ